MGCASTVSAASEARQQRVMLEQKHKFGAPTGTFVLYGLTEGLVDLDSGTFTLAAAEQPYVVRHGQRIAVYVAAETLAGRRGTLSIRWRVEFVGAGLGATVGTGSWSVLRGTGRYAGLTGGGRLAAVVMTPRGFTSAQLEGLITSPALRAASG
jgi:hypothetical protein